MHPSVFHHLSGVGSREQHPKKGWFLIPLIQTIFMFPCAFSPMTPGTASWHTRPLTPCLQQRLPLQTIQVNSAYLISKSFPDWPYSSSDFTGLIPSFPEVPTTTIATIPVIFCCLFLLALALSFGYTHKMCLQGVCDINRQDMWQQFVHYFYWSLLLLSQLKATVLKASLSGPWSYFLFVFKLTCLSSYEALNWSSCSSQWLAVLDWQWCPE